MECDETAVSLFHSRQLDGQCKPVLESCVTFVRAGCLTLTGVERWESHECIKTAVCARNALLRK